METEIYKNRSISGCIKTSLFLFISQINRIIKGLYLPTIACSIMFSMLFYCLVNNITRAQHWSELPIFLPFLLIGTLLTSTWFQAALLKLFNQFDIKTNFIKVIIIIAFQSLLLAIFAFIAFFAPSIINKLVAFVTSNQLLHISITGIIYFYLIIILLLFLISCIHPFLHYTLSKQETFLRVIKMQYPISLKHIGFWIGISLLTWLICAIVQVIITMPINILMWAKIQSLQGELLGDSSGLPSLFGVMTIITLTIVTFCSLFLWAWVHGVFYYAYGSIVEKTKIAERIKNK